MRNVNFHRAKCPEPERAPAIRKGGGLAFTLLELLVAIAITALMLILLVTAAKHAGQMWSTNEQNSRLREKARLALEVIGDDLRQARLPLDLSENPGLQFVMNPSGLNSSCRNRDSLFWQIPAKGSDSQRDQLAAVGYFVRRTGDRFALCRLYIPSSDTDFPIYDEANWISSQVDLLAPADAASSYRGLFLEDTVGIWIRAYRHDASLKEESYVADSRTDRYLPDKIEVILAFIDSRGMARLGGSFTADDLETLVKESLDANEFIAKLPDQIRRSAGHVTLSVPLASRLAP